MTFPTIPTDSIVKYIATISLIGAIFFEYLSFQAKEELIIHYKEEIEKSKRIERIHSIYGHKVDQMGIFQLALTSRIEALKTLKSDTSKNRYLFFTTSIRIANFDTTRELLLKDINELARELKVIEDTLAGYENIKEYDKREKSNTDEENEKGIADSYSSLGSTLFNIFYTMIIIWYVYYQPMQDELLKMQIYDLKKKVGKGYIDQFEKSHDGWINKKIIRVVIYVVVGLIAEFLVVHVPSWWKLYF